MANLTQDELVALVLTKLKAAGNSGSGSGESTNPGMSEDELKQFNDLLAKFAALQQVAFEQLNTNDLFAKMVEAGQITVDNAFANYLAVLSAVITNLDAEKISANYINVENLKAVVTQIQTANIDELFADYIKTTSIVAEGITVSELLVACGKFLSLIANSLSVSDIEAFKISSDNVTFKNASIKNAAIESVSASKINTGTLNTTKVALKDSQDKLVISDGLIQISDNTYVRVQIGRIAANVYDMRIWDEDGKMMWSASGITAAAIKDAIIVDDMISEDANISSNKINIASLVTALNENGNIETKSSNITIDAEGQKLSTWFNTIESWKSAQSEATSNLETDVEIINGKLSTFVSQTDIATINGEIEQINSKYSSVQQSIEGLQTSVQQAVTTADSASTTASQVQQTVEGLSSTVSSVQTQSNSNKAKLDEYADSSFVNNDTFETALTEFRQAADNITITVLNSVNDSDTMTNFNKWFKYTADGLVIGSDDNNIKLTLDNNKIAFIRTVDNTETVLGEWNGVNFYTKNIVVGESMSLKFGNFEMLQENQEFIIRSL